MHFFRTSGSMSGVVMAAETYWSVLAHFCGQCARARPFLCSPWPNSNYPVPNEVLCGKLFGAPGGGLLDALASFILPIASRRLATVITVISPPGCLTHPPYIKIQSSSSGHRTNCLMTIWNQTKTGKQTRVWNKIRYICKLFIIFFSKEVEMIL